MRKAYDKHEDHRDVGGTYLASKSKRVPVITFVAQQERAANEAADNLDHRVKGEEGGQQIKDLEVKKIKMGKKRNGPGNVPLAARAGSSPAAPRPGRSVAHGPL